MEIHSVSSVGTVSQPPEIREHAQPAGSDTVAESGYAATPLGAPVVRELQPDLGPHERLLTVREVAGRLGVSPALVYKLCQRNVLPSLRIGGALRFQPQATREYMSGGVADDDKPRVERATAHPSCRMPQPPVAEGEP